MSEKIDIIRPEFHESLHKGLVKNSDGSYITATEESVIEDLQDAYKLIKYRCSHCNIAWWNITIGRYSDSEKQAHTIETIQLKNE